MREGPNASGDEPIPELRRLEGDVSPLFLRKLRSRIYRRSTAAQFASFSWRLPGVVLLELSSMLMQVLNSFGSRKGGRR
jgi:hypothetical protein